VIHFAINSRLAYKVSKEVETENAENCRSRLPHCCLTPHPRRFLRMSAYTLHF